MSNIRQLTDKMSAKTLLAMAIDEIKDTDEVVLIMLSKDKMPSLWLSDMHMEQLAYAAMLLTNAWQKRIIMQKVSPGEDDGA